MNTSCSCLLLYQTALDKLQWPQETANQTWVNTKDYFKHREYLNFFLLDFEYCKIDLKWIQENEKL